MKQKYTVTVAGMTVNIISDEQEEYVNGLVRLLDQRIEEMVSGNKRCSKTEAILFCAIDYFDDKELIAEQAARFSSEADA